MRLRPGSQRSIRLTEPQFAPHTNWRRQLGGDHGWGQRLSDISCEVRGVQIQF